jgi:hypothetical protein
VPSSVMRTRVVTRLGSTSSHHVKEMAGVGIVSFLGIHTQISVRENVELELGIMDARFISSVRHIIESVRKVHRYTLLLGSY